MLTVALAPASVLVSGFDVGLYDKLFGVGKAFVAVVCAVFAVACATAAFVFAADAVLDAEDAAAFAAPALAEALTEVDWASETCACRVEIFAEPVCKFGAGNGYTAERVPPPRNTLVLSDKSLCSTVDAGIVPRCGSPLPAGMSWGGKPGAIGTAET